MGQDQQIMAAQASEQLANEQAQSALYRKVQAGRDEHQTRAMSVPKALRLTLAKVADDLFDLAMAAIGVRMEKRGGDALEEIFDGPVLLMSLDGTSGRRAAAVLDPLLVGGLIQQQTMGKVMPETGDATRTMTATDAAICAPFLDALLERAAVLPETESDRRLLQGYRFGSRAEDARVLQMTLEESAYQIVHITVDIACGTRQGQITLCLPMVPKQSESFNTNNDDSTSASDAAHRPETSLSETVMALHVNLNVALARLSMPLSALGDLAPGGVLELGVTAFDKSRVLTMAGCTVGQGTLGQIDGVRALRVEHQANDVTTPKRRASDRDALDQPEVAGDGTGTQGRSRDRRAPAEATDIEQSNELHLETMEGLPDLPDLPDMSGLPDLPELPDMSDLPGLSDDADLPDLSRAGGG